jgi:hypothetical protein
LWWTKWKWDRFFPSNFFCPCPYHTSNAPY